MITKRTIFWLLWVTSFYTVGCQSIRSSVSSSVTSTSSSSTPTKDPTATTTTTVLCAPGVFPCSSKTAPATGSNFDPSTSTRSTNNSSLSPSSSDLNPIKSNTKLIVLGDLATGKDGSSLSSSSSADEASSRSVTRPTVTDSKEPRDTAQAQTETQVQTQAQQQQPWNSNRWAKLPIRRPKLRLTGKPVPTKTRRIAYGSMVRTRSLGEEMMTELVPLSYKNSSQAGGQDVLEISSSEKRTSRMRIGHPRSQYQQHHYHEHNPLDQLHSSEQPTIALVPSHPYSPSIEPNHSNDRITGRRSDDDIQSSVIPSRSAEISPLLSPESGPLRVGNNKTNTLLLSSSSSSSLTNGDTRSHNSRNIPKLLLPKFSRPAMYSLNGFIPKPNIQRLTTSTSTTSTTIRPSSLYRTNRKESARSYNLDKNNQRKYNSKHRQSLEESDDLKISGSTNRLLKRRGYVSSNKQRSSSNSFNSNSRYKLSGRRGEPGKDFPTIDSIPKTSFDCKDHVGGSGFYADPETGCQVWHMCQGHRKHSFLCPNGTIFNQKSGVCDWWYNVECEEPVTLAPAESRETTVRAKTSGSSSLFEDLIMGRKRYFY